MTTTLHPARTREWIAALRSGDYTQTQGQLRQWPDDKHCCLGVACEVSGLVTWGDDPGETPPMGGYPPRAVDEWLTGNPCPEDSEYLQDHLAKMNDERNRSFEFIARFLEVCLALQEA